MQVNKFVIGGFLILGAVVFLIWSSTAANSEYFLTIDELNEKGDSVVDRNVRLSGAVLGDSIQYDAESLTLTFEIAHVPDEKPGLRGVPVQLIDLVVLVEVPVVLAQPALVHVPEIGVSAHAEIDRVRLVGRVGGIAAVEN